MLKINRFVIGIRPQSKLFRLSSLGGVVIDALLSERGNRHLRDEYFTTVSTNAEPVAVRLQNEELGNTVAIDASNIAFSKDAYRADSRVDLSEALDEFNAVWKVINEILKVDDVRRIGMVAEHQIEGRGANVNEKLMRAYTAVTVPMYPARFSIKYEERRPTADGLAPDIHKSDFINVIHHVYDAEMDSDHSAEGSFNANVDVQRYYSPLLASGIQDEVRKLRTVLDKEVAKLAEFLRSKGLIING